MLYGEHICIIQASILCTHQRSGAPALRLQAWQAHGSAVPTGESTSRTTTASSGVGNVRSSSHIASALATKFAAYLPLTGGACRDVSCSIFQLLLNFSLLLLFLPFLLFLLSSLSFFFIFFFFSFFFFFKCLSLQRHVDGCATAASESRTFHSVTVAQWLG